MPNTDPSLTHTFTTRSAGEGVWTAQEQHNAYLHGEIDWLRAALAKRDETIVKQEESNENLWRDMNKVRASNGELRSKLARAEAIEAPAWEVVAWWGDNGNGTGRNANQVIQALADAIVGRQPTTATRTVEQAWLVEESTVYTLDESGQNRIYANFQGNDSNQSITYRERCELARRCAAALNTPTQTEAEVERLKGEVDERDSTIANLHVSLDAARLDAKRLERVLADLRAKLDALVSAVDKNNAMIGPFAAVLRAADAARQPTEAT